VPNEGNLALDPSNLRARIATAGKISFIWHAYRRDPSAVEEVDRVTADGVAIGGEAPGEGLEGGTVADSV
jgi:hypothetical protein